MVDAHGLERRLERLLRILARIRHALGDEKRLVATRLQYLLESFFGVSIDAGRIDVIDATIDRFPKHRRTLIWIGRSLTHICRTEAEDTHNLT